jgi:hypothetical protein
MTDSLPVTNGLYARYQGKDYDNNKLNDSSGKNRHITVINNTDLKLVDVINPIYGSNKRLKVLEGSTASKIQFTTASITEYTLFHVLRYTGKTNRRILQGDENWLSGFWSGKCYVAYHNKWITKDNTPYTPNWILSTDYAYNYRGDGKSYTTTTNAGMTNLPILYINGGYASNDSSTFQLADIIIYERELSISEIESVEKYLADLYGLTNAIKNIESQQLAGSQLAGFQLAGSQNKASQNTVSQQLAGSQLAGSQNKASQNTVSQQLAESQLAGSQNKASQNTVSQQLAGSQLAGSQLAGSQ